jgi:uncharacterized protein
MRPNSEDFFCALSNWNAADMSHDHATTMIIRDISELDYESIVRLNDAEARQTSPMDGDRLRLLLGMSIYCKVATVDSTVAAFLIAMQNGVPYENDNYRWFVSRFPTFLYVDRIVVDSAFAGLGIGRKLYEDLFEFARSRGIESVTCEYNVEPPNPASRAFHDKFGFVELATQWVAGRSKKVSLQAART